MNRFCESRVDNYIFMKIYFVYELESDLIFIYIIYSINYTN